MITMLRTDRLKSLRKSNGKIQQDIADFLGVGRTTYVKYENGDSEPPLDFIVRLACYFEVSTDFLLGKSDNPTPPDAKKEAPNIINDAEALRAYFRSKKGRDPTPEEFSRLNDFAETLIKGLDE